MKGDEILIETTIGVNLTDTLGDTFDKKTSKKIREEFIEEHIREWSKAHDVERRDVEILKSKIIPL
jgi:hypothetical protein